MKNESFDNIQARIRFIAKIHNETLKDFLQNIGFVMKYLTGEKSVKSDIIATIIEKYPRVNLLWLLTGKGVPVIPTENEAAREIEKLKKKEKRLKEKYNACCEEVKKLQDKETFYLS